MSLTIKTVKSRSDLRKFVDFPESLYGDNPYYVPKLFFDQMDTLDQKKGAAQEFCDSELYMAYKDGKLVGRVAAIINNKANKQWNHKEVRFGWIDFIDDPEVSAALMEKVEDFGRARGMEYVVGPLGFTDFDPEGMLIDGFDKISTMPLIYNHPYYVSHIESMGFEKDIDWEELKITIPEVLPDKMVRVAEIVKHRANVHVRETTKRELLKENYGRKLFKVINECYKDLYEFTVLPETMSDKYLDFYLKVLDLRYISLIENENNELVAFGIIMPSIARALQKSRGKLFPFGWYHILKSLFFKHEEGVELLLIGVHPDYRNTGINALVFEDVFKKVSDSGFKWAESNAILESNVKNMSQFLLFETEKAKRRRSYRKLL